MTDAGERLEDTVRRLAKYAQELERWQAKYREAAELWDALELQPNDQVVNAVIIAKATNFETGEMHVVTAASEGTDWVDQLGLYEAWKGINIETRIERRDDE